MGSFGCSFEREWKQRRREIIKKEAELMANSLKPPNFYTPFGNFIDGEYKPERQAVLIEPYKLYGGSDNA